MIARLSLLFVVVSLYLCFFFFFQAEDGIRDLVRSRGLGDVYKRQTLDYNSIFVVGLLLFLMTLALNILSRSIVARFREVYE